MDSSLDLLHDSPNEFGFGMKAWKTLVVELGEKLSGLGREASIPSLWVSSL